MTYKPLPGTLLVKPIETEETTPGGAIVLLQDTRDRLLQLQAEVVAVGDLEACDKKKKCRRTHDMAFCGFEPIAHPATMRWHVYPESLKVGAWILMEPRQLVETLAPGLFVLRMDAVLAVLVPS